MGLFKSSKKQLIKNVNVTENKKKNKVDRKDKITFKAFFISSFTAIGIGLKNTGKFMKKHWILSIIFFLILILLILAMHYYNNYYDMKNKDYADKMQKYGFDKMYNNGSATPHEKVTKSEAVKMIIASIYNVYDISGFAYEVENKYPNEIWTVYAEKQKIIPDGSINADNESKSISYIDVLQYYLNARSVILNKTVNFNKRASFSNLTDYNESIQNYINDAVENKLIDDSTSKFKGNKTIDKAKLNKLVINFVEKYNTITVGDAKLNINPDKLPSNADEYPYILANVEKSVYEKPLQHDDTFDSPNEGKKDINPIDTYINKKEYYSQMKLMAESYFNTLINVNYETIDLVKFKNDINSVTSYEVSDTSIIKYIQYVKEHKIKLSGKAEAQLPVVYCDGVDYRIRMKLIFKVENSDTMDKLLFKDLELPDNIKAEYKADNNILIDAKLERVLDSKTIFVYPVSIMKFKID